MASGGRGERRGAPFACARRAEAGVRPLDRFGADDGRFLCGPAKQVEIVSDPAVDLFAPLANSGERGKTIVREIHVVASHNSCHTGELGILQQLMGLWK